MLAAACDWLHAAAPGYCAFTSEGAAGDCRRGHKGNWRLSPRESTWLSAVEFCVQRCVECERCRYISVSVDMRDCSWFYSCNRANNMSALHRYPPGFRSASVLRTTSRARGPPAGGTAAMPVAADEAAGAVAVAGAPAVAGTPAVAALPSLGCRYPMNELTFNSILHGLFNEGIIPAGGVLDVGANDGTTSCMLACFDARRTVHAVDPSPALVARMACTHPNMLKANMAISDRRGRVQMDAKATYLGKLTTGSAVGNGGLPPHRRAPRAPPPCRRLAQHGAPRHRRATPARPQVEGHERAALGGARGVLARDRPFLSVEVHLAQRRGGMSVTAAAALLRGLAAARYRAWVVEERCGVIADCRNLLCIPNELVATAIGSPTLTLAVRSGALRYVDAASIGHTPNGSEAAVRGWEDYTRFPAIPPDQWEADCAASDAIEGAARPEAEAASPGGPGAPRPRPRREKRSGRGRSRA
eukprot:3402173-Prymnesium_polylepis.1